MADQITLNATTGRTTGTRPSRRLRAEGAIPAVVYGPGADPISISVDWKELRAVLTTDAGLNALIILDVDGDQQPTLVKELQRHPVRRDVLHVDFIVIDPDKPVDVDVPIVLFGEDEVADQTLVIDQVLYTLPISAKPAAIPNELRLDISSITLESALTAGDIALPEGVELDLEPDEAVVTASLPTREPEPEEVLEGEEGELEGDVEGEGAEDAGDAAEGGDDGGDEG